MWNEIPFGMHGIPKIWHKNRNIKTILLLLFFKYRKAVFLIHKTKGQVINPEHKTKLPMNRVSVYIAK